MNELAAHWPEWLGSPSQVALLVIVVVTLIKTWPILQKQVFEARHARENRYGERIRHLETELEKCHRECTENIARVTAELHGMREQRLAEQGAIMRAIVRMSGDPEVKKQLDLLEAMEFALRTKTPVEIKGPINDRESE